MRMRCTSWWNCLFCVPFSDPTYENFGGWGDSEMLMGWFWDVDFKILHSKDRSIFKNWPFHPVLTAFIWNWHCAKCHFYAIPGFTWRNLKVDLLSWLKPLTDIFDNRNLVPKPMAASITWLVSFEKSCLRVISAMMENCPLGRLCILKYSIVRIIQQFLSPICIFLFNL